MKFIVIVLLSFIVHLSQRIYQWRRRAARVGRTMPVVPVFFPHYALIRRLWPKKYQSYYCDCLFQERKLYDHSGNGIIALIALFGSDSFHIANAEAVVEITNDTNRFPKDLRLYGILEVYGRNILTTEGPDWRRHRKITSRAFSERNHELVFEECVRQTEQMMESWKSNHQGLVVIEKLREVTMKFALHITCGAGFGVPLSWENSGDETWPQHKSSFREAIAEVVYHIEAILVVPKLLWRLPIRYLRTLGKAYNEFNTYMLELVDREGRQASSDNRNVLRELVKHIATGKESQDHLVLEKTEIVGNIFILLIAGVETSGITLLYAILMLALHPSVQDTLLSEIEQVCHGQTLSYEHLPDLIYPLCVMYETMRMYPPVAMMPKRTFSEQTLLGKYLIPANATLFLDPANLHHNPNYWGEDIYSFNPSRFDGRNSTKPDVGSSNGPSEKIKIPTRGSFCAFSEGTRICLGKKFAQIEFVTVLVMLVTEWSIELKEGWTPERVWAELDKSASIITMSPPTDIPVVFKRRVD